MDAAGLPRRLERLAHDAAVPGAQFALYREGRTWTCEFGEREHGTAQALTNDTKIPIGSVSKTFTATLAMVLVSDGDLDLDTPLTEYLPELRQATQDPGGRRTLRQLLSHTSGLPSDAPDADTTSLRRRVLDCVRHLEPLHAPGRAFSYSNLGYVIAGHLIEAATGMSWWEALELVLLKPLGISPHSVLDGRHETATGHAVNPAARRMRPVRQSLTQADAPAGALAASASDLVMLGRLLTGTTHVALLNPAALAEMRAPVPAAEPFGMADGWGLGLARYRDGDRTWLGHDGTGDGTACHLRFDPASGTVVALTTNGSTGFPMWHRLVAELRDLGLRIGDYDGRHGLATHRAGRAEHAACAGDYRNGDIEYSVREVSNALRLTVDGEPFAELTLYQGLVFGMRDADTGECDQTGRFLREPDRDEVGWIQVGGRLARRCDRTI